MHYDIKKLKELPIVDYLESIGIESVGESGTRLQYFSPFRTEHTPSFWVDLSFNTWKDFGLNEKGGDIIDLVQSLEKLGRKQAFDRVHFLKNNLEANRIFERATYIPRTNEESKKRVVLSVRDINNKYLIDYAESRGISEQVSRLHLSQVQYLNPDNSKYSALGMRNIDGGIEIRGTKGFKCCIGHKAPTIFNRRPENGIVSIFEGMFDFLSLYELKKVKDLFSLNTSAVILHSVSLVGRLELSNYEEIHLYLDNDDAGKKAVERIRETYPTKRIKNYSYLYQNANDLNDFLCQKLKK